MEVWKDIPGFDGVYQASTLGNIRRVGGYVYGDNGKRYYPGHVMALATDKDGYKTVGLMKDKKYKTYKVHRLVAMTFIPNPNNYPQINHKDERKDSNNVFNLEWCSNKYNMNYGTRSARLSAKMKGVPRPEFRGPGSYFYGKHWTGAMNKNSRKVAQYDLDGNLIKVYDAIAEAGRLTGINSSTINNVVRNIGHTAGGYKWAYAD